MTLIPGLVIPGLSADKVGVRELFSWDFVSKPNFFTTTHSKKQATFAVMDDNGNTVVGDIDDITWVLLTGEARPLVPAMDAQLGWP